LRRARRVGGGKGRFVLDCLKLIVATPRADMPTTFSFAEAVATEAARARGGGGGEGLAMPRVRAAARRALGDDGAALLIAHEARLLATLAARLNGVVEIVELARVTGLTLDEVISCCFPTPD